MQYKIIEFIQYSQMHLIIHNFLTIFLYEKCDSVIDTHGSKICASAFNPQRDVLNIIIIIIHNSSRSIFKCYSIFLFIFIFKIIHFIVCIIYIFISIFDFICTYFLHFVFGFAFNFISVALKFRQFSGSHTSSRDCVHGRRSSETNKVKVSKKRRN